MKKALGFAAVALATFVFSATVSAAPIGFSGPYAPGNWTVTITPGSDGSVNTAGAPGSVQLFGSDNGGPLGSVTDFTITSLYDGVVSFDWMYNTNDRDGAGFDPFGILLNGVFTILTNPSPTNPNMQMGSFSFNVLAGDVFGFRILSTDNVLGRADVIIKNFDAPTPEPASFALWGIGGGIGLIVARRRAKAKKLAV